MKNNCFPILVFLYLMTSDNNLQAQSAQVIGTIKNLGGDGMEKVHVTFTSPGQSYPTFITQEDGMYAFDEVSVPSIVSVHPVRDDNHRNGVSTLDLVRIQRHMLGGNILTSPYQLIAADANNSGSLSAIDLVILRKIILGIYPEFPDNTSWRFFPEEHVLGDTLPPNYSGYIDIHVDAEITYRANFVGIKIGDVNQTAQPFTSEIQTRSSLPQMNWITKQQEFSTDDLVEINFSIAKSTFIQGFQFTISSPELEFLEASSDFITISDKNYAMFGDKITFSWYEPQGINVTEKDVVLTLKAQAKSNGNLRKNLSINSDITEAEVYSESDEIFVPKLIIQNTLHPVMEIISATPNPWKETNTISFNIPMDGEILFELFDLNGKRIYNINRYYEGGQQEIHLNSNDFDARGLLIYSITSGSITVSNKMIVLD